MVDFPHFILRLVLRQVLLVSFEIETSITESTISLDRSGFYVGILTSPPISRSLL